MTTFYIVFNKYTLGSGVNQIHDTDVFCSRQDRTGTAEKDENRRRIKKNAAENKSPCFKYHIFHSLPNLPHCLIPLKSSTTIQISENS